MTQPTAIGEHIKGMLKTRMHPCGHEGCLTEVDQTWFCRQWTPEHCEPCMRKLRELRQMSREERTRVEKEQAGKTALLNLRVPALYRTVTLDTYQFHGEEVDRRLQTFAVKFGRDYLERWPDLGEDRMLVTLRGGVGTGKGHWAWSVCKAIASEHGLSVAFIRLPDLIRELRASWKDSAAESEIQVLDRYRKKDLLFIDEVSRHSFYGQGFQHLLDVIDHRVNNQRPTILTTNDDDANLAEILGAANWSRLNGCGGILEFGSADWRSRDREAA